MFVSASMSTSWWDWTWRGTVSATDWGSAVFEQGLTLPCFAGARQWKAGFILPQRPKRRGRSWSRHIPVLRYSAVTFAALKRYCVSSAYNNLSVIAAVMHRNYITTGWHCNLNVANVSLQCMFLLYIWESQTKWTFFLQVDAEQYYSELEEKRTDEFNAEKNRISMKRLGIAFVTFRDERMTAVWVQHDTKVYVCQVLSSCCCHSREQLSDSAAWWCRCPHCSYASCVFQHREGLQLCGLPSRPPAVQHHHCGSVAQMGDQLCACSQWHHLVSVNMTGTSLGFGSPYFTFTSL